MTIQTDDSGKFDISKVVAPDINISAKSPEQVAEVIQQIEIMNSTRHDYIVQSQHVVFEGGSTHGDLSVTIDFGGVIGVMKFGQLTIHAHRQIATTAGIPWTYYSKMLYYSPTLLASNLNQWLALDASEGGYRGKMWLCRTISGRIRAWLSDQFLIMDNSDLFFTAHDKIKQAGAQWVRIDMTEERMYLRALIDDWALKIEHQRDIAKEAPDFMQGLTDARGRADHNPATAYIGEATDRPGPITTLPEAGDMVMLGAAQRDDLIIPGICLSNSEIGLGRLTAESYMLRVYCLNGAIFGETVARTHRGRSHNVAGILSDTTKKLEAQMIFSEVGDLIEATFKIEVFKMMVEQMSTSTGLILEAPLEAIDNVAKNYGISDADKQRILDELITGGDPTLFGLMNAITATGRDKDSYSDGIQFERMGVLVLREGLKKDNKMVAIHR